jgi:Fur family peroxide stress response transcriptional regulator
MRDIPALTSGLQKAGMRLTPQRLAICELLGNSSEHPTAMAIYEQLRPRFPSLSLATVYNTLERLVGLGLITVLGDAGDDALHYDADTEPHVNLACISCARIIDIPSNHVNEMDSEITAASGFKILGARLLYYGLCPDCQKKASRAQHTALAGAQSSFPGDSQ